MKYLLVLVLAATVCAQAAQLDYRDLREHPRDVGLTTTAPYCALINLPEKQVTKKARKRISRTERKYQTKRRSN